MVVIYTLTALKPFSRFEKNLILFNTQTATIRLLFQSGTVFDVLKKLMFFLKSTLLKYPR